MCLIALQCFVPQATAENQAFLPRFSGKYAVILEIFYLHYKQQFGKH